MRYQAPLLPDCAIISRACADCCREISSASSQLAAAPNFRSSDSRSVAKQTKMIVGTTFSISVQHRIFESSNKSWEALCAEASAFASEVGGENVQQGN